MSRDCLTSRTAALAAFLVGALGLTPGGASAGPTTRAWVLDSGSRALVALELPSGKRTGSLALSGSPWTLLQSPDGSRLIVLDRGPGEDKHEQGYKAAGRSSATIVDPATMTVVGRVELGSGIQAGHWYFGAGGRRLTLLCPGYEPKNPAEAQARELVSVDLAAGRESGRLTLEPGSVPIFASSDGEALPVIQGLPRRERFPYPQSRLFVVDLSGPSVRTKLDMGGWTNLYTDGSWFYLLAPGRPDKDPNQSRNGTVQVVSLVRGALGDTLDAGRGPLGLFHDEAGGQVFVPNDGAPGSAEGELRVLRGGALAATLKVAAHPRLVVRKRGVVFVVGQKAATVVDPVTLQVTAQLPLRRGNDELVHADDEPTEVETSADGKRAFVLYGWNNKVAVLDVEHGTAVGAAKTGSGGKKFLGNMMKWNGLLMGGGIGQVLSTAGQMAVGYSPWSVSGPRMLAVRPDGAFAYAINTQTKDVTVVDGTTGKSVEIIAGGGHSLELLQGGHTVAEVSGSELRLIDAERNQKAGEISLPGLRGLFTTPDCALAVALAKQAVLVLDGASGKALARLTGFVSPEAIAFEKTVAGD